MMTGMPRPSFPERREGEDDRADQMPVGALENLAATKTPPRAGAGSAIKQLFRHMAKIVTGKDSAPRPTRQRKRSGEDTRRAAFLMAAKRILEHAVTIPVLGYAFELLSDMLDWLNPYWNQGMNEFQDDAEHGDNNHLSPHP
jgi:hypothetical protein